MLNIHIAMQPTVREAKSMYVCKYIDCITTEYITTECNAIQYNCIYRYICKLHFITYIYTTFVFQI